MNTQTKSQLFSEVSSQSASQTKGGHWGGSRVSVTVVVPAVAAPVATVGGPASAGSGPINITNPVVDYGSIVNIPGGPGTINVTNPYIDDGSIVNF